MPSNHNANLETISSLHSNQQVEVSIEAQGEAERVVLRYLTWTEGLGWCCQKTMRLEGEQVDELHRALTVARHRLNRRRAETGEFQESAKVIQLPTIA
ncbi:MAG TPA: hypothetical protein VGB17_00805 [Pyrinomonadaceae bacterium]